MAGRLTPESAARNSWPTLAVGEIQQGHAAVHRGQQHQHGIAGQRPDDVCPCRLA
jgi:hypothetical protein